MIVVTLISIFTVVLVSAVSVSSLNELSVPPPTALAYAADFVYAADTALGILQIRADGIATDVYNTNNARISSLVTTSGGGALYFVDQGRDRLFKLNTSSAQLDMQFAPKNTISFNSNSASAIVMTADDKFVFAIAAYDLVSAVVVKLDAHSGACVLNMTMPTSVAINFIATYVEPNSGHELLVIVDTQHRQLIQLDAINSSVVHVIDFSIDPSFVQAKMIDQHLYVVYVNSIVICNLDGNQTNTFTDRYNNITDIISSGVDQLYILYSDGEILLIPNVTDDFFALRWFPFYPTMTAVDTTGSVYIGMFNVIAKLTPDGLVNTSYIFRANTSADFPTSMLALSDGSFICTFRYDNQNIYRTAANGSVVAILWHSSDQFPVFTSDRFDRLILFDASNHLIKISADGSILSRMPTSIGYPQSIAVNSDSSLVYLITSEYDNGAITLLNGLTGQTLKKTVNDVNRYAQVFVDDYCHVYFWYNDNCRGANSCIDVYDRKGSFMTKMSVAELVGSMSMTSRSNTTLFYIPYPERAVVLFYNLSWLNVSDNVYTTHCPVDLDLNLLNEDVDDDQWWYYLWEGFPRSLLVLVPPLILMYILVCFSSSIINMIRQWRNPNSVSRPIVDLSRPLLWDDSFLSESKATAEETCAICIEPFMDGMVSALLRCAHKFHRDCIREWTFNHTTCPICRTSVRQITTPPLEVLPHPQPEVGASGVREDRPATNVSN